MVLMLEVWMRPANIGMSLRSLEVRYELWRYCRKRSSDVRNKWLRTKGGCVVRETEVR